MEVLYPVAPGSTSAQRPFSVVARMRIAMGQTVGEEHRAVWTSSGRLEDLKQWRAEPDASKGRPLSMPGLMLVAFLVALTACSNSTSPSGVSAPTTMFYVSATGNDRNPGTTGAPWLTLQHALSLIHGGDTVYLRGGTYNATILETSFGATGTSWSSFLTISAYPGEAVTLQPGSGLGNVVRFQDTSIHHVLLQDLILDGILAGGGSSASVIYCGPGSHDLHFNRVEIKNGDGNGSLCYGTDIEFRDMSVHGNGGPATYPNANGMYMTGSRITIIAGEYYDNACFGVRFWDSAHPANMATQNRVVGAKIYNNGVGIGHGGASTCGSGGGGLTIGDINNAAENNLVYGNYWGSDDSFGRGSGNSYVNNTFHHNLHGIKLTGDNTIFVNNTIYANGDSDLVDTGSGNTVSGNTITPSQSGRVAARP